MAPNQAGNRKRRFSPEFKLRVVAACRQPGATVSSVSLAHNINANIVHRWVREFDHGVPWIGGKKSKPHRSPELRHLVISEFLDGALSASALALKHSLSASTVQQWVKPYRNPPAPGRQSLIPIVVNEAQPDAVPILIAAEPEGQFKAPCSGPNLDAADGQIVIELSGTRLLLKGAVDQATLRVVLENLRR
jgi:transposase-like protein